MALASLVVNGLEAVISSGTFGVINYLFSMTLDHGKKERKKHDLKMEYLQKDRVGWNEKRLKKLDFINKGLRDKKHAKQAITDLKDGMRKKLSSLW